MNEDKSSRYHRLKRWISMASLAWTTTLLVLLLATGTSIAIRQRVSDHATHPSVIAALMILVVAVLHEPVSFALAFYGGYIVEHRYGLSRQTLPQWIGDYAKAATLGLALAVGLGTALYAAIAAWPGWWWLIAGLAASGVMVLLAQLAPVLLLPLFFRFAPLDRPDLVDRLKRLAAAAGARIVGVYRWELESKTRKANAALTGLGATRRILIADTMLAEYSDDEIEVVLAHELAHHVHRDIWSGILLETGLTIAGFWLAHSVLDRAAPRAGLQGASDPAGLPLLVLAAGAVSVLLLPAALAVSRSHERRADGFALDLTGKPAAFVSAMRRLGSQNLAEARPSRLVQWLFYSHPPLHERIAAAERWHFANAERGTRNAELGRNSEFGSRK